MNLADEVRRIVASDLSALNRRMSHNENQQLPLHFAVRMNRPAMLALLLELPLTVRACRPPRTQPTRELTVGWAEFFQRGAILEILPQR